MGAARNEPSFGEGQPRDRTGRDKREERKDESDFLSLRNGRAQR